ncbi:MAG: hypothetical protein ACRDVD_09670 [Acidimicrobiia bacterium]
MEMRPVVGKSKTLIFATIVALAAIGGGVALASGGESTQQTTEVDSDGAEDIDEVEDANEADEVEDANEVEDTVEGPDVAISGADLDRATAAALAYLGEGRVTGTEVGDEESYYEVEVTLDGGRQVDVQLDKSFNVVGSEGDRDGRGED